MPSSVIAFQMRELSLQATKYNELCRGLIEAYKPHLREGERAEKCFVTAEGLVIPNESGSARFQPWGK